MTARLSCFLLLAIPFGSLFGQSMTIRGTVTDKATSRPIDSAIVEIVNRVDPSERYAVATSASGTWSYSFVPVSVESPPTLPVRFPVEQNYPNPFNPSTRMEFSIGAPGTVTLTVHNAIGQLLETRSLDLGAGEGTP